MKVPFADSKLGKRRLQIHARQEHYPSNGLTEFRWNDEERFKAVSAYVALGKLPKVAKVTGIPYTTLREWKYYSSWWKPLELQIREENNKARATDMESIATSALNAIKDRLTNGDYLYNPRSGEIVRVPVNASQLNKLASTMIDKKLLLEKNVRTDEPTNEKTIENKLEKLADAFKSFAAKNGKKLPETIDGELVKEP